MTKSVYSNEVYAAAAAGRGVTGESAFAYTDSGLHTEVHPDLTVKRPDGRGAVRESRDSPENPQARAIGVIFDETGSMQGIPRVLQQKLPLLNGLLLRKGYVAWPQILFSAVGDATCDGAPLQIGQFEADNRMDDDLSKLLLEGGGGGGKRESYELAMYFMARHTAIDCWEKRGQRGYLFIIGDEMAYPRVKRAEVAAHIGDTLQSDIPVEEIVAELTTRWDVYYILPKAAGWGGDSEVLGFWRDLLGQNVIELDDTDAAAETIALTIGLAEGTTDLDSGLGDLDDAGSAAGTVVSRALAPLAASGGGRGVAVASPPGDLDAPSGNTRL